VYIYTNTSNFTKIHDVVRLETLNYEGMLAGGEFSNYRLIIR